MRAAAFVAITSLTVVGCERQHSEEQQPVASVQTQPAKDASSEHHYFHKAEQPHKAEWGYSGDTGPGHWGDLSPDYVLAKTGQQQSPIDLTGSTGGDSMPLRFDYHASQIDLVYNGHTIEEIENQKSLLLIDEREFALEQFHFHSPSEHTVDGKHFAMEMHLVHKSSDDTVAVVAVFIEEGEDNAAFDAVWDYLPTEANRERTQPTTVDAGALLPESRQHFSYTGSFTTPPCTEDVQWIVMKDSVALSKEQITRFRAIIDHNNRPVQPLNGRTVSLSE